MRYDAIDVKEPEERAQRRHRQLRGPAPGDVGQHEARDIFGRQAFEFEFAVRSLPHTDERPHQMDVAKGGRIRQPSFRDQVIAIASEPDLRRGQYDDRDWWQYAESTQVLEERRQCLL